MGVGVGVFRDIEIMVWMLKGRYIAAQIQIRKKRERKRERKKSGPTALQVICSALFGFFSSFLCSKGSSRVYVSRPLARLLLDKGRIEGCGERREGKRTLAWSF